MATGCFARAFRSCLAGACDTGAVGRFAGGLRGEPCRWRAHRFVGAGAPETDIQAALPEGASLYDAAANALRLVAANDLRRVTGYLDFVDWVPLDPLFVADRARMKRVRRRSPPAMPRLPPGRLRRMSVCSRLPRLWGWIMTIRCCCRRPSAIL